MRLYQSRRLNSLRDSWTACREMNRFPPYDGQHAVLGQRVKPANLRGVAGVMDTIRHSFSKS